MSEPCPPGYTRIKGVCVKNPTPDPPTLVEETEEENDHDEDQD